MTKLPQSLEKIKQENLKGNAPDDLTASLWGEEIAYENARFSDGFDAGAIAVLEKAEKLAEVLEKYSGLAHPGQMGPTYFSAADEALAEWKAWRGEE